MVSLQAAIPIYGYTFTTPVMNKAKAPYTKGTIMDYINNNKNYTILRYLLQLSGLDSYMNERQPKYFTLLLTDNESLLKRFTRETLKYMDRQNARDLIFFHVLMGKFDHSMFKSYKNVKIPSQLGTSNPVHLIHVDSKPTFNGVSSLKGDKEISLSNGLLVPITVALDPYIA